MSQEPRSHFARRCLERGIRSVPGDVLAAAIRAAVLAGDESKAEFVKHVDERADLYRFRVAEGVFYALVGRDAERWPRTVYTQRMKRKMDRALKSQKKRRSMTGRRAFLRFEDRRNG